MSKENTTLIGIQIEETHQISTAINWLHEHGSHFVAVPLLNGDADNSASHLSYYDYSLKSEHWSRQVVGCVQLDLSRTDDLDSIANSMETQLECAQHLSLGAVTFELTEPVLSTAGRICSGRFGASVVSGSQLWAALPMAVGGSCVCRQRPELVCPGETSSESISHQQLNALNFGVEENATDAMKALPNDGVDDEETADKDEALWSRSPWHNWHAFRTLCDYSPRLGVALQLTPDIPDELIFGEKSLIFKSDKPFVPAENWSNGNFKETFDKLFWCLIISTDLFLTNQVGCPVLSKAHQSLFWRFLALQPCILLVGENKHDDLAQYLQYLNWLIGRRPPLSIYDQFSRGYEDHLQFPLQPLKDNLEAGTYEVFEQDPVKYRQYELAIQKYFLRRRNAVQIEQQIDDTVVADSEKSSNSMVQLFQDNPLVVMILGAGRGPLVTATITAARLTNVSISLLALEKNRNAVHTLRQKAATDELWLEFGVDVIEADMRHWYSEKQADLIVSELLGSFGDNELSPECLDGAERLLKPDGVIIPQNYTSFLAPLQSQRLHCAIAEAQTRFERGKPPEYCFELSYVVKLHNCWVFDEPKPVFSFEHPSLKSSSKDGNEERRNERFAELNFSVPIDAVLHGFAGFFEATLYDDVMISTRPSTHSPDMFSWFPLLLPLQHPIPLTGGDRLQVLMWRLCRARQCWYEWCVTRPHVSPIHNPMGRSHSIGL